MSSTFPVIAALDGSPDGLRAATWAARAARRRDAALRLVHVWPYRSERAARETGRIEPLPEENPVLAEGMEVVCRIAPDVPVSTTTLRGMPREVLPELGREADLLVVGSRGLGGFRSLLLGSVGLAVASRAACPVIVVRRPPQSRPRGWPRLAVHGERAEEAGGARAAGEGAAETDRDRELGLTERDPSAGPPVIVVGVDPDADSRRALSFAVEAAEGWGARVHALTTWSWPVPPVPAFDPYLSPGFDADEINRDERQNLERALAPVADAHPGVEVTAEVMPGDAAAQLVAASAEADLLVLGRREPRGLLHPRLGPVGHATLLHSECPVAVVPL
ncbi:universal stress protein [Allostreptomyces psammosilenae]|uniref:Nucleotide-binding universal stress UspA family protein n=1 Tax=Allostreptomyces psammosilenae TaxID=1892865 RepID=A0A852ZL89_9ACTN|nr:universal stress protein [Allostreptomyces psammosilenae]NYI03173.1 nucleotide-binding universal stress UspA family protein [Allostreptomyces psammosilenae]